MPIYEYWCKSCGWVFEELVEAGLGEESLKCPKCGKPRPEKVLSCFATGGGGRGERGFSSSGSCGSSGGGFS